MLQLDLGKAAEEIKKRKAKTVALQVPEGLKTRLAAIVKEIEGKTGATVFSFLDPCFGACDAADEKAKALGADLLLHFGHTQFLGQHEIETVFLPLGYELDKKKMHFLVKKLIDLLKTGKVKKVALSATIQFLPFLDELKKELLKNKFAVFIGKGRNVSAGQVLGCNYSAVGSIAAKCDAIVFLGDGLFHPLGISFCCSKPVFVLNPLQEEVKLLLKEQDLFLRKRIAMIEKAKQAKVIAIWVSSKRGQQRMQLAIELKEKIEAKGKKALVFVSDLLLPDYLLGMQVDAIVCTACPRIALDDSSLFRQPIVNPSEMLVALGEKKLQDYGFDELI
jgi:2-(3-amino-3-carboxypropyl)histidine synthase